MDANQSIETNTQAPAEATTRADRLAFFALIVGAISIGFAPIFMRLSEVGTSAAAFWRGGLSVPVLLLLLFIQIARGQETRFSKSDMKASVFVGFFFALDLYFWHWAVDATTVANATLLSNLAAVFTALFAYFVWKNPIKKGFWFALILTLGGAAILVGVNAEIRPEYLFGDFLGVLTAVAYAAYILGVAKVRQHTSTLKLMLGSSVFQSVFLLLPALTEQAPFMPADMSGWTPLLLLAVVSHVFGQGLIAYGLMAVPAALGSLTLLVQPVVAAVVAWIIFAEALGPLQGLGAVLVLLGVYFAKRNS